jgi:hypothetical protein
MAYIIHIGIQPEHLSPRFILLYSRAPVSTGSVSAV